MFMFSEYIQLDTWRLCMCVLGLRS